MAAATFSDLFTRMDAPSGITSERKKEIAVLLDPSYFVVYFTEPSTRSGRLDRIATEFQLNFPETLYLHHAVNQHFAALPPPAAPPAEDVAAKEPPAMAADFVQEVPKKKKQRVNRELRYLGNLYHTSRFPKGTFLRRRTDRANVGVVDFFKHGSVLRVEGEKRPFQDHEFEPLADDFGIACNACDHPLTLTAVRDPAIKHKGWSDGTRCLSCSAGLQETEPMLLCAPCHQPFCIPCVEDVRESKHTHPALKILPEATGDLQDDDSVLHDSDYASTDSDDDPVIFAQKRLDLHGKDLSRIIQSLNKVIYAEGIPISTGLARRKADALRASDPVKFDAALLTALASSPI